MLHLARQWWVLALRGLFTLIFGFLTLLWPQITLEVLALIFGAYMFLDGFFALLVMVFSRPHPSHALAFLVEGIIGIVIGVLSIIYPFYVIIALIYLLAAWAIITGLLQLVEAWLLGEHIEGESWLVLSGLVSLFLGVLLALAPQIAAYALAWLLGLYALVAGASLLALGLQLCAWYLRYRERPTPPSEG